MSLANGFVAEWDNYFFRTGDAARQFWDDYIGAGKRDILLILARGIDPRMCEGARMVFGIEAVGKRDCLMLDYDEGAESATHAHSDMSKQNEAELRQLLQGKGEIRTEKIPVWNSARITRRRISTARTLKCLGDCSFLHGYTDVIIDVSSMRRSIYIPLIERLLQFARAARGQQAPQIVNIHVLLADDPDMDHRIASVGLDDSADYMPGFTGDLEMEANSELPKVWVPALGEAQYDKLERIYALVKPIEICPILPVATSTAKRSERLLLEYRQLLFDTWEIEPGNLLYAAEKNPFDVYRQIRRTVIRYNDALMSLGGCKFVMSAVGSKQMSIGVLLACHELKNGGVSVAIAHVEPQGYTFSGKGSQQTSSNATMSTCWLAGDCYLP